MVWQAYGGVTAEVGLGGAVEVDLQVWGDRLLATVLTGVARDLPELLGAALTVQEPDSGRLRVLTSIGDGQLLADLQVSDTGGPVLRAATRDEPVVTANVWEDARWPELNLAAVFAHHPDLLDRLRRVQGVAAMPSIWGSGGLVVLSVSLPTPADTDTLRVLARHEQLAACAVSVLEASSEAQARIENTLDMLQSRAAIEQAKGMVMAVRRCTPTEAWTMLRQASNQLNIKLRHLAVALVEYLTAAPAEQPDDPARQIQPTSADQQAAAMVWQVLAEQPDPHPDERTG